MINPQVSTRVPSAVVDRLERCADAANAQREPRAPRMDRASIVRVLILQGLPALERAYGIAAPPAEASRGKATPRPKRAPKRTARSLNPTPHKARKRGRST
jgi:hypothetical protein